MFVEVLLVSLVLWEIVVPLLRGLPLFPLFRRKRQELLMTELEHAKQDLVEDDIEEQVRKLRREHDLRHPEAAEVKEERKEPRTY